MKWINLAEKEPDYDNLNVVMRLLSKDMVWMSDDCNVYPEGVLNDGPSSVELIVGDQEHYWPMKVVEWLDETDDVPEGYMRVDVRIGSQIIPPIENPIQEMAPGLFKIGNAYTGQAGAELVNEHIKNLFKGNPLESKK